MSPEEKQLLAAELELLADSLKALEYSFKLWYVAAFISVFIFWE